MSQKREFSDEELVAYLDGEEDFAPVDEIKAALESNAALAVRLTSLRVDRDVIAASFSELAAEDRPRPVLPERISPRQSFSMGSMAAAAMIALLLGYGAGFFTGNKSDFGWREYVAAYQALYANSTLAHINQTSDAKAAELKSVAAAIGKTINPVDVQISPSVDYKRAQILNHDGRPLIQLAFLSSTGEPLALCIIRSGQDKIASVATETMEGMSAAYWSKDGYEYLLIGGTDQGLINDLAARFAASI